MEAEQLSYKVKPVRDYGDLGDIYIEHIVDSVEVRATHHPLRARNRRPHTTLSMPPAAALAPRPLHPFRVPIVRSCVASFC